MSNQGRSNSLDAVKVLMAFLVISIHTITPGDEFKYLLTQGLARIAVPFFFIAAGYYISTKNGKAELYKATKRLLILYLSWCLLYSPFIVNDIYNASNSIYGAAASTIYQLLKGWRHMWFMPAMILGMIFYFYLKNYKWVYLLALTLYVIGVVIQNTMPQSEYSILYYRNFITFGFPLIALGAFIRRDLFTTQGYGKLSLLLAASLIMLAVESLIRYKLAMYNNDMLFFSPIVASALFLTSISFNYKTPLDFKTIASSMYFVHFLFYLIFKDKIQSEYLLFFTVALLSLIFSFTFRKSKIYTSLFT
ncbi:acyltransferase family protein [Pantoea sp. GM_Pan_4]|uniref:acyltransferase family protein n=1 Tax=Pantoea sp. GM_Pan_4 TaxID=2937389 RepID=UPI00226A98A1|nr:acyltransferase family protein [Pantoea sp. GM_Pan_4]